MSDRQLFNDSVSELVGVQVTVEGGVFHRAALSILSQAQGSCEELKEEELAKLLTTYLTAHYYAITNPVATSKSVNGVSKSYSQGTPGKGLESTPYGRQAIALDPCQALEKLSYRRAGVRYVGTT